MRFDRQGQITWRLERDGCKCEKATTKPGDSHEKCRQRWRERMRAEGRFTTRNCFNDTLPKNGNPWDMHAQHPEGMCDGPEWAGWRRLDG